MNSHHRSRPVQRFPFIGALVALIMLAPLAEGQDRPRRRPRRDNPPVETASQAPAEAAKAPEDAPPKPKEPDRWFAVTNARVHTISGGVLEGATVLCRNGKIAEIGLRATIPEGAEVIDATGMRLYPGLVALQSNGVIGAGAPEDSTDVFSLNLTTALAAGITTAVSGNTAAKLTHGTVEDMILARDLFESLAYSTRTPAARHALRASLDRVRQHLRDVEAYEQRKATDPSAQPPDDGWLRGEAQNHLRLLKGEAIALATADSAHELHELCAIAEEYGIDLVVRGGIEAWTLPIDLSRAGVSLIITPRARQDADPDLNRPNGSSIENAAILARHGVTVGFIPVGSLFGPGTGISFGGLGGRDLLHLNMEAAFAVRGGMTNDEAIRAITLDAARILGVDDRIGSIDVGKDADFVICDGDLLHYMTLARWTVVNGRIAYDKEKEPLLSHIRPGGDRAAPPPPDVWPRRLGAPW